MQKLVIIIIVCSIYVFSNNNVESCSAFVVGEPLLSLNGYVGNNRFQARYRVVTYCYNNCSLSSGDSIIIESNYDNWKNRYGIYYLFEVSRKEDETLYKQDSLVNIIELDSLGALDCDMLLKY